MCMLAQEAYVKSSFKDSMKHYRVGGVGGSSCARLRNRLMTVVTGLLDSSRGRKLVTVVN